MRTLARSLSLWLVAASRCSLGLASAASAVDSQADVAKVLQAMSDTDGHHMVGRRADGSEQVWDFAPGD